MPLAAVALLLFPIALLALPNAQAQAAFGFQSLSSTYAAPGGQVASTLPAGSHPELWTAELSFNTTGPAGAEAPDGALRNLEMALPPGLVGAPALLPECARSDFFADACPASSAIGQLSFTVGDPLPPSVLYLIEPPPGIAAQLGTRAKGIPVTIDLSISPRVPHNLIASTTNASQVAELFGATLTIEGTPNGIPFLTLPRSCAPLTTVFTASPWQLPGPPVTATAPDPQVTEGCATLSYSPTLSVVPTTSAAAAPSGLDLALDAPDPDFASPGPRAAADTSAARLSLPPGLTLNPPLAAGLLACTPSQLATELPDLDPATGCPEAAKVGTATVDTPLFAEPIAGSIYVAEPDNPATVAPGAENPFDSRFALYLILSNSARGILLSLPIRLDADPDSGRLTATFDRIPQLPLSHLDLHFNSGPHAPLTTPATCGPHEIAYELVPSSGNPPLAGFETFITATADCAPAFAPTLSSGTSPNVAGRSGRFVLDLEAPPTAPNLSAFTITLPPGLSADLAGAKVCPEVDAATASCSPGSKLGYARIALGTGSEPLWVPSGPAPDSSVFLAGPYRGAPYSLLISIPARAGPYYLGTVIARATLSIDPITAQASVRLDRLPQVLGGVPLRYRTIRLVLDRPGFIRNPTSCAPMQINLNVIATNGASANTSERFRTADCAALAFRPRIAVRVSGGLARNAHPQIEVDLIPRSVDSNIAAAAFTLPPGELLDLRRIRALCPRDLAAAECPAASRLGNLRLLSPLLPEALRGPIYLRRPSGRYPDLLADLHSGNLHALLQGSTAAGRGGRVRVSFTGLPDLALTRTSIDIAGGRNGIIVNSASLCVARPPRATVGLKAHNGKRKVLRPKLIRGGRC